MNQDSKTNPEDRIFEHNYDGIQEYDNPMPGWWVGFFWATIIFSVLYVLNVIPGLGSGKGKIANYEAEMAKARETYARFQAPQEAPADDVFLALAQDGGRMTAAKALFSTNCAACHRPDGGGLIGPNLTDPFWIHGGRPADVWRTIQAGVLDKGMPAWGQVLKPEDVNGLTAYVLSIQGTNPENPKAPQGTEAGPAAADTTAQAGAATGHDHAAHADGAGGGAK